MSESDGGGPGRREVAYRLFAAEYDDADLSYSESDEERAPNYVVTPSGARVNRLFLVGVLTEVESVSDDYLRARVVDPTGPFVIYAGQYQPEAMRFLESAEPPTFVAVTGKARTFQPEDSDRVYTSVRPESINEVDADTRDRWVIQAAEGTIDRTARVAEAKASGLTGEDLRASLEAHGVDEGLASGIPLALEHYGTSGEYVKVLREVAEDALRVVAGEQDEVEAELPAPDQGGDDALAPLVEESIDPVDVGDAEESAASEAETAPSEPASPDDASTSAQTAAEPDDAVETEATADVDAKPDFESEPAAANTEFEDDADLAEATEGPDSETTEGPAEPQVATSEGGTETESEPPVEGGTAAETTAETETTAEAETETETSAEAEVDDAEEGLGDFEGDFDLDEEEREEIESEYGTEFKSGTEVEEPGEADIDTPDPEDVVDADEVEERGGVEVTAEVEGTESVEGDEMDPEEDDETVPEEGDEAVPAEGHEEAAMDETPDETGVETADAETEEAAGDVELDDTVMDAMVGLDDGDGADRDAVIAETVDRTGADPGDVEDAIQDALMDGLCYEPEDGKLKPI